MISIGLAALAPSTGPAMHIPDGFLSAPVSIAGWVVAVVAVAFAARRAERQMNDRAVPLMGVMAAFVFATQMMNFPVAGGTSGHLLGGALVAILLGPWAAMIVMAAVIGLQAVLFQDGGLVALGANITNMGVVTVAIGYLGFRLLSPLTRGNAGYMLAAGIAAWLSVVVSSVLCAIELGVSGTSPLSVALPAMAGLHVLIGLGEAAITAAALSFIRVTSPGLLVPSVVPPESAS
ncbi:MAG: energy-coupling factor ABC transporter permease [Dehalococcoidia bacterium]